MVSTVVTVHQTSLTLFVLSGQNLIKSIEELIMKQEIIVKAQTKSSE